MTARRRMPFGSGGDAARAAAAPALAELRTELLVMPRERRRRRPRRHDGVRSAAAHHASLRQDPRRARPAPPRRVRVPRRVRHARELRAERRGRAARTAPAHHRVDRAHARRSRARPHRSDPALRGQRSEGPGPATERRRAGGPEAGHAASRAGREAREARPSPSSGPRSTRRRPSRSRLSRSRRRSPRRGRPCRPKRVVPKQQKKGPKPSNDSTNTPAGYPDNWRTLAAAAATAKLQACAQADALSLAGLPAGRDPGRGEPSGRQRSLVAPERPAEPGAVVVAQVHPGGKHKSGPVTTVTVYERVPDGRDLHRGRRHPSVPRLQRRHRRRRR